MSPFSVVIITLWIFQAVIFIGWQAFSIYERNEYNWAKDEPLALTWWQLVGAILIPLSAPLYFIYWTLSTTFKERKKK